MGVGEAVVTKLCFESWLWEMASERISHLHIENSVFMAQCITNQGIITEFLLSWDET